MFYIIYIVYTKAWVRTQNLQRCNVENIKYSSPSKVECLDTARYVKYKLSLYPRNKREIFQCFMINEQSHDGVTTTKKIYTKIRSGSAYRFFILVPNNNSQKNMFNHLLLSS